MSNFDCLRLHTEVGGRDVLIETGRLANQADGAVWIQSGDTVVLVTAVTQPLEREVSFLPLVVDYVEKMYAAGRVPGSFFRREIGRPSERETLCSRLIDRPIRPLFPKGFNNEIQVIATVLSADQENDPDILAVTGASAALHMSKIPFQGPIAAARIGLVNGEFVFNPRSSELAASTLNMVMAASKDAVVMVEGMAKVIPSEMMAKAIAWGHERMLPLLALQEELRAKVGVEKMSFTPHAYNPDLKAAVIELASEELAQALKTAQKMERKAAKKACAERVKETIAADARFAELPGLKAETGDILSALEKEIVRKRIKEEGLRIDGRDVSTVRAITIDLGLLPRTHGSALFARGETKALCVATLGSGRDEQRVETLMGDDSKRFMLHYNFPPFCVGEIKMLRLSRREIGHGNLAERAIMPVLPEAEAFPFTLRIVSEVMESNGSSSMASVCGASLALMDAGVPIKAAVAGIAMGLIKEGDDYFVLTDIMGDEDALGDMDFKIAGTADGVTAFQMDIKIAGIPPEVMAKALAQAKDARMFLLGEMAKMIETPRAQLSEFAPQLEVVQVNPDIIRVIIGPGGKNIKALTAETGADIDIEDSGKVSIFAPTLEALSKAKERIMAYDARPEEGKVYEGPVRKILEFGCLVEVLPGVEGMVHVSELALTRVEKVSDVVKLGDVLKVKCIKVDAANNKFGLSRKAILAEEQGIPYTPSKPGGDRPRREGGFRDRDGGGRREGGYRDREHPREGREGRSDDGRRERSFDRPRRDGGDGGGDGGRGRSGGGEG